MVQQAAGSLRAPLLLFVYFAQLQAGGGLESFCHMVSEAGAAGGTTW